MPFWSISGPGEPREKVTFPSKLAGDIARGAEILRSGGLVAFPTETVYGLGANALDRRAVARIFEAKGRPSTSPLIVHVSSREMLGEVVRAWPKAAEKLAAQFWPGPLTLVVPKSEAVPHAVTAGLDTVGVRMPDHKIALELIGQAGVPVAAPSANRFTQLSPTRAEHVAESLGTRVDLIIDGGPTQVGIESTVVAILENGRAAILRPGMIHEGEIAALVGPLDVWRPTTEGPHMSPGQHDRHYSPRTKLILTRYPVGHQTAYLWYKRECQAQRSIQMPTDAPSYAAKLYEVLHQLDGEGWESISVEPVPEGSEWAGIRDRLERAAKRD